MVLKASQANAEAEFAHQQAYKAAMRSISAQGPGSSDSALAKIERRRMELLGVAIQRLQENRPVSPDLAELLRQKQVIAREAERNPEVAILKQKSENLEMLAEKTYLQAESLLKRGISVSTQENIEQSG